jgi:hypothetical protein
MNLDHTKAAFILGDSSLSFPRRVLNRIRVTRTLITNNVNIDPGHHSDRERPCIMGVSIPILSALCCYVTGTSGWTKSERC